MFYIQTNLLKMKHYCPIYINDVVDNFRWFETNCLCDEYIDAMVYLHNGINCLIIKFKKLKLEESEKEIKKVKKIIEKTKEDELEEPKNEEETGDNEKTEKEVEEGFDEEEDIWGDEE